MVDPSQEHTASASATPVDEALEALQALSQQGRFRDFWERALEVEGLFMTERAALGERFDRLWGRYERLCGEVRREEASRRRTWEANASRLERELQRLATQHRLPADEGAPVRYRFGPFFAHLRDLQTLLEGLDLAQDDRERLTAELERVCAPVRELYAREQEESRRQRQAIEAVIADALARAEAATDLQAVADARARLRGALDPLREAPLLREDRDACWAAWREASGHIALRGQGLQDAAFAGVQERAQRCLEAAYRGDPYEAVQQVRALQEDLARAFLRREQREQLRQLLSDAWERARVRIGEVREERQRRRQERERRQEQWRQRMAANLERWVGEIQAAEAETVQLQRDIEGLQEEQGNATNPSYAQVLRRLVEEKRREMARLRRQIEEWQAKVQDVRARLEAPAAPRPMTARGGQAAGDDAPQGEAGS